MNGSIYGFFDNWYLLKLHNSILIILLFLFTSINYLVGQSLKIKPHKPKTKKHQIVQLLVENANLKFMMPNNDCDSAEIVCSESEISFNPQGPGFDDFANPNNDSGCLFSNENQSSWYYFEMNSDTPLNSSLTFVIDPDVGGGQDYDFAIYGPDVPCDNLGSPIRCSFAAGFCTFCPQTGLGNGETDTSEPPSGNGFVAPLIVNPGEGYFLLVDNFSSNSTGFSLNWGDPGAPFLNCNADPDCDLVVTASGGGTYCEGQIIDLIGSATGTDGTEIITWTANPPFATSFIDNPSIPVTTATFPPGSGLTTVTFTYTVTNAVCELSADVIITITPPDPATPASLEECENGTGSASFDLTSVEGTVSPGGGVVTWFENSMGTPPSIPMPDSYESGGGLVYAVVTDVDGCVSLPTEVSLTITPPDPATPASLEECENGTGLASFDLTSVEGTVSPGGGVVTWFENSMGTPPSIPMPDSYESGGGLVYAVVTDVDGCVSLPTEVSLTITPPDPATPASLEECENGTGLASFDLTSVEGTVSPGGGVVTWFENSMGTPPSIPMPDSYESGGGLVYAVVTDVDGCVSLPTEVSLTITPPDPATPASLEECENGTGLASFDLTSVEGTVSPGGGVVTWFENSMGTPPSIPMPDSYESGGGLVYAVVTDVDGCVSLPTEVSLTITPPDPATPASLEECENGTGSASFDLTSVEGTVSPGGGVVTWFENSMGTPPSIPMPDSYESGGGLVYAVVTDVDGCVSLPTEVSLTITPPDPATPASLEECENGTGSASFDLTSVEGTVSPGGGVVTWFENSMGTPPSIPMPDSYESGGGLVYAVVTDVDGCVSLPTEVSLTITPPDPATPASLEECENGTGSASFDLTSVEGTVSPGGGVVTWFENSMGTPPSIPMPDSYESGGGLVYAVVTDVDGCVSLPTEVSLTITPPDPATPASLEECENGTGLASFDLTSVEGTVSPGGGVVTWFENSMGTPPSIPMPDSYESGGGLVYAVVTDVDGCVSLPTEVSLTITPPDPATPASLEECENGTGLASFDLTSVEGTVSPGGGVVTWFENSMGTPPSIPMPDSYESGGGLVYAVVTDVDGCVSLPTEVSLTLLVDPIANSANLDECDNGSGQAIFNLNSIEGIVSPEGFIVTWFDNPNANPPSISNPTAYLSGPSNVYAVVENAMGCISNSSIISLNIIPPPQANPGSLESCNNGNGQSIFDLTSIEGEISSGNNQIIWYNNPNLFPPAISNTSSYLSGNATIYATAVSLEGCESEFVEVDLIVVTPICDDGCPLTTDSFDDNCNCVFTPPNVDDGCPLTSEFFDATICEIVITPPDPDDNCPLTTDIFDSNNCVILNLPPDPNDDCVLTVDYFDPVNCIIVNDPPLCNDGCIFTMDYFDSVTCDCVYTLVVPDCDDNDCATIDSYDEQNCICIYNDIPPPLAFDTEISSCEIENGSGIFNLTQLENIVNGGLGNNVDWFDFSFNPILNSTMYEGVSGFVYGAVYDLENPVCQTSLATIELTVIYYPNSGDPESTLFLCNDQTFSISLDELLSNADGGGQWTEVSNVQSTGSAFNANSGLFLPNNQMPGMYEFQYTLEGVEGCLGSSTIVSVEVVESPTVDFSADNLYTCGLSDSGSILDFQSIIVSGDVNGTWSDIDAAGVDLSDYSLVDFDGVTPGLYVFEYTTNSAPEPCNENSYQIFVTVEDCTCPSVAVLTPEPLCNQTNTLELTSITVTSEPGTWSISDFPEGTNPILLNGTLIEVPDNADIGAYQLTYTLNQTPGANCPSSSTVSLYILPQPDIELLNDLSACDFVTLPTILGENLTNNTSFFTAASGGGAQYQINDFVDFSGVFYAYDENGGCFDEVMFNIEISTTPILEVITPVVECDEYVLEEIGGIFLTGDEAYYSESNGAGQVYFPGDIIENSTNLYVFDQNGSCSIENILSITINNSPVILNVNDVNACESYTLPTIQGDFLSGNEAYYTEQSGMGIELAVGSEITESMNIYIYDTNVDCPVEESFYVEINTALNPGNPFEATSYCNDNSNIIFLGSLLEGEDILGSWAETGTLISTGDAFNEFTGTFNTEGQEAGTYEFTYTLVAQNGCPEVMSTVMVGIEQPPSTEFSSTIIPTCNISSQGSMVNLSELPIGGDINGTWMDSNNEALESTILDFDGFLLGSYFYFYSTSSAVSPCQESIYAIEVVVEDCSCPSVSAAPFPLVCNTDISIQLSNFLLSTENGSWAVSGIPDEAINIINIENEQLNVIGADEGEYELTWTLDNMPSDNCPQSSSQTILVTATPSIVGLPNQNHCFEYILPEIEGDNLGQVSYYTLPGGQGTQLFPGDMINVNSTIYIFAQNENCNDQTQFDITINDSSNSGIPVGIYSVCNTNSELIFLNNLLLDEDLGGHWAEVSSDISTGTAFDNDNGTFLPDGQVPGTYIFEYSIQGSNNCPTVMSQVMVEVLEPPFIVLSTDNILTCNVSDQGSIVDLNALIIEGDLSGTWVDQANQMIDGDNLDFDGFMPGQYVFTYTTNSAEFSCEEVEYNVVVVVEDCSCPSVAIGSLPNLCNISEPINLSSLQITSEVGTWSVTSGPNGGSSIEIINGLLTVTNGDEGNYEITFTLTEGVPDGCPNSSSINFFMEEQLSAGFGSEHSQCNEEGIVDLFSMLSGNDDEGIWTLNSDSDPVNFNSEMGVFDPVGVDIGTYIFDYSVGENSLCPLSISTVFVNIISCACPPIEVQNPEDICHNQQIDLAEFVLSESSGFWSISSAPIQSVAVLNGNIFDANMSTGGNYELTYALSEAPPMGCPTSTSIVLVVGTVPSAGTPVDLINYCEGIEEIVDLNSLLNGAELGGVWEETSDTTSQFNAFNALNGSFNVTEQNVGLYSFNYTVYDPLGLCPSDEVLIEVNINDVPELLASDDEELDCNITEVSISGIDLEGNPVNYSWVNENNETIGTDTEVVVNEPGTFTVTLTSIQNGCIATGDVVVTQDIASPTVDAGEDILLDCDETSFELSAVILDSGDNIDFEWSGVNSPSLSDPNILNPTGTDSGVYSILVTNSSNGCSDYDEVLVSFIDGIYGVDLTESPPLCPESESGYIVVNQINGGSQPLDYFLNGENYDNSPIFSGLPSGEFELSIEDENGCLWDTLIVFEGIELPYFNLGPHQNIELGEGSIISVNSDIGLLDTIIWEIPDGLEYECLNFDCTEIQTYPNESVTISATIFDENGCSITSFVNIGVQIQEIVFVPNAFSPNSDGENEVVYVQGGQDVALVEKFLIFDRWGELVFDYYEIPPNDPNYGWDGTHNGELMNNQVLVYHAVVRMKSGRKVILKGDITLIK